MSACPTCHDAGWLSYNAAGFPQPPRTDEVGVLYPAEGFCDCAAGKEAENIYQQERALALDQKRRDVIAVYKKRIVASGIPAEYYRCDLHAQDFPQSKALGAALAFYSDILAGTRTKSVYILGPQAHETTHLVCALGMSLLAANNSVMYQDARDMMATLREAYSANDGDEIRAMRARTSTTGILILDSLDPQPTEYTRNYITELLQARQQRQYPTILAGHLRYAALVKVYSKNLADIVKQHFYVGSFYKE